MVRSRVSPFELIDDVNNKLVILYRRHKFRILRRRSLVGSRDFRSSSDYRPLIFSCSLDCMLSRSREGFRIVGFSYSRLLLELTKLAALRTLAKEALSYRAGLAADSFLVSWLKIYCLMVSK